jgi:hypothetical protein
LKVRDMDALKNLKIERWYQIAIALGFVLIVVASTIDTKWLTNKQTGLMGAGLFFVGLGAWKNMKVVVQVTGPPLMPPGIAQYSVSKPDPIGVTLWAIGLFCLALLTKDLLFT